MGPSGLVALLAGWFTTEIGRQPWVVYGVQRTRDAVSAHGDLHMSLSLLAFIVVYASVFGVGYVYLIRLIKRAGKCAHAGGPDSEPNPCPPAVCGARTYEYFGEKNNMGIDLSIIWFTIIVFLPP